MKIEQMYTGCLAQGAYYIECDGEVAIIDPLREVQGYVDKAQKDHAKIKYIFETHFHADFVSGHLTLSKQTEAPIVFGPTAEPGFEAIISKDGQVFPLGNCSITVLHTPGHTLESATYLLKDANDQDHAIFTGDTLFLGDVGRPDLAQKATGMTEKELAGVLFDSLRTKIMPLDDSITVYPAHGAGSACGKNMMKETVDTLGNQKKSNYALKTSMTKKEFVQEVTKDLLPPPAYFPLNVQMNKEGYEDLTEIMKRSKIALSVDRFDRIANETGAVILDVRHQNQFVRGHIPRSIFIGLGGTFAPWVGALIKDIYHPILLVTNQGEEEEAITRLSRVGFDNTLGYLKGGFDSWKSSGKEIDTITSIKSEQLEEIVDTLENEDQIPIFDVRAKSEFITEHMLNAMSTPLPYINEYLLDFPADETFYLYCAGGYRSVIAASILKSRGVHNLVDISGGFSAIKNVDIPISEYVCPTTL